MGSVLNKENELSFVKMVEVWRGPLVECVQPTAVSNVASNRRSARKNAVRGMLSKAHVQPVCPR